MLLKESPVAAIETTFPPFKKDKPQGRTPEVNPTLSSLQKESTQPTKKEKKPTYTQFDALATNYFQGNTIQNKTPQNQNKNQAQPRIRAPIKGEDLSLKSRGQARNERVAAEERRRDKKRRKRQRRRANRQLKKNQNSKIQEEKQFANQVNKSA